MRQSRNIQSMILTTTVITEERIYRLEIHILSIMQKHFMKEWKKKVNRILSICFGAHGQEARNMEHLYGQAILPPAMKA